MDYLTEDTILPKDQKFVCLSFLTDKENKKELSGIKIRGVFISYEEACEHAKKCQTVDPAFHVFVGECGKWLPYDPNPDSESVKNSEYANEQLNTMMKTYMENQEKSKIFHEQRKNEMVRQNIIDNLNKRKENLAELEEQLKATAIKDYDKLSIESTIKSYEEQIKNMEAQKEELDTKIEVLNNDLKNFDTAI
jgi:hypothetical protein